jgi:hypothetical protein
MPWSRDGETFFTGAGAAWATYSGDERWEWMAITWRQRQVFVDEDVFRQLLENGNNYDIAAEDVTAEAAMSLVKTTIEEMEEAVNEDCVGHLRGHSSTAR